MPAGIRTAEVRRVLLVRLSALGDVVNALPALTALRRMLPDAHIAWAVEPPCDQLLRGHPLLDEVIAVPRRELAARLRSPLRWPEFTRGMRELRRDLRRPRFDVTVDLQGNLRSGIVTWLSGARHRIGPGPGGGKELSHLAYTLRVRLPERTIHRVERGLLILSALGEVPPDPEPVLRIPDATRAFAREFYAEHLADADAVAALHPGVSGFGSYKQWPPERFTELIDMLNGRGVRCLLTWGPGERQLCERIASGTDAVVGPETKSLAELVAMIGRADVFVGADSGPARLAWAAGTPTVAIFGPKDPAVYGPTGERSRVVQIDLPCRPCRRRTCPDPRCVTDIPAEAVFQAVCQLLDG